MIGDGRPGPPARRAAGGVSLARATAGGRRVPPVAARSRVLGTIVLSAIYALCFAAIKAGLPYAPPLRYGGLRALIAGAALLGLAAVLRRPLVPARRALGGTLALALVATTLGFGAMFLSPGRTGAGIASVLGNTQPLLTIVLAAPLLGERITRRKALALALGLGGVALIAYPALAEPEAYGVAGPVLALAAALGATGGTVIAKRMDLGRELLTVAAWQLILGSLPLLAASAFVERGVRVAWSGTFVALLLFLALVGTAFANAYWYWLLGRHEAGDLTLFLFFVPLLGLGLATLLFGEAIGLVAGLGVALTLGGIGVAVGGPRACRRLGGAGAARPSGNHQPILREATAPGVTLGLRRQRCRTLEEATMITERTTVPIEDLGCGGGGTLTIERALGKLPGVRRVAVNPLTEMAYVEYDPERVTREEFRRAIERAGFRVGKAYGR